MFNFFMIFGLENRFLNLHKNFSLFILPLVKLLQMGTFETVSQAVMELFGWNQPKLLFYFLL